MNVCMYKIHYCIPCVFKCSFKIYAAKQVFFILLELKPRSRIRRKGSQKRGHCYLLIFFYKSLNFSRLSRKCLKTIPHFHFPL